MATMVSVNKETVNKKFINVSLLAMGTVSHAWFDDESDSVKQLPKQALIELLKQQRKEAN